MRTDLGRGVEPVGWEAEQAVCGEEGEELLLGLVISRPEPCSAQAVRSAPSPVLVVLPGGGELVGCQPSVDVQHRQVCGVSSSMQSTHAASSKVQVNV